PRGDRARTHGLPLRGRGRHGRAGPRAWIPRPQRVPGGGRGLLLDRAHGQRARRAVRGAARVSMGGVTPIEGVDLDHVAVAVERWADAWPRFVGVVGGRWMSGGRGPGFAPCQIGYANQMRVEILEPNEVERNDFLRRFLDRSGPGPHHLTFKVKDLEAALSTA